jgi:aminoglycoside phosphotransferase (APT) family kinase protein
VALTAHDLIPVDLVESIQRQTGASLAQIIPRGGGGASRQGAQVTLVYGAGKTQDCYLAFDTRAGDPARLAYHTREVAILSALGGALQHSGVRAPSLIAHEPSHLALLTGLSAGDDRFAHATDKMAVAKDYAAQLVALHKIDPASVLLNGFDDHRTMPAARIRAQLADWRAGLLARNPDPILMLALTWLAENIPDDSGPSVIVHGDAGPGNFNHADNKVTALLDWELTHFGDPMEDLAQCWVRSLIQPFVPMSDFFAAYEAAGGVAVDIDRVRYHRLYFQMSFMVPSHIANQQQAQKAAMLGSTLMFSCMHRRVVIESIAELSGVAVTPYISPEIAPSDMDPMFDAALEDIRHDILPRLDDQHASTKAKSLARIIKFWRARDRYGAAFDALELSELAQALGQPFETLARARTALAQAIDVGEIDRATALQVCHNRVTRETTLMGEVMGALAAATLIPPANNIVSRTSS